MEITRRTVLGAGAALPFAAVPTMATAAVAAGPSPSDWADLNGALRGSVGLPGSTSYRNRMPLFDPHWDFRRPAAVARVLSSKDVATCVTFAKDHGLQVTGRSGGHSYVGASATTGSLVIDTRSLRTVTVSPGRTQTTVGAGANLYSVHVKLSDSGLSLPTGTCPTVGTAGLTLAGGLGVDSRRYGLTADRLVRATVVDHGDPLQPGPQLDRPRPRPHGLAQLGWLPRLRRVRAPPRRLPRRQRVPAHQGAGDL